MAIISIVSRLVGAVQRNVDLSANTLLVQALSTGTNTLTDTILGNLLTLQNGTLSVPTTLHAHDGVYTRTSALTSAVAGSAGSTLIGDNNSYTNYTPAAATVKGALSAIDTAIGTKQAAGSYITALTGDVSATGPGAVTATLSSTGVAAGTYNSVTVDVKGRVTSASTLSYANQTLSNLTAPTAVNQNLVPLTDSTYNLGTAGSKWQFIFTSGMSASANISANTFSLAGSGLNIGPGTVTPSGGVSNAIVAGSNGAMDMFVTTVNQTASTPSAAVRIESGNTVTANTGDISLRTGVPSTSGTRGQIILNGSAINASNSSIINVNDPTTPQGAATKNYVDNFLNGLSWKTHVRSATAVALPSNTYANGTAGVGATLTGTVSAALTAQDGVTLVANDRLLVKNEAAGANNGVYIVTQVGSASLPYILTRSSDMNSSSQFASAAMFVDEGTSNAATAWVQSTINPITVGTSLIVFAKFSSTTALNFRNGLLQSGANVDIIANDSSLLSTPGSLKVQNDAAGAIITGASGIKVQVATTGGIQISSNSLAAKLADTSLQSAAAGLSVLNDPAGAIVTVAAGIRHNLETTNPTLQIATNQIGVKLDAARAITTGTSGIGLNVDAVSTEISANALRIKSTAYDQATITGGSGTAAAVQSAPLVQKTLVAGQAFAANTTFVVRWGLNSQTETSNQIYAADIATASADKFHIIGIAYSTGAVAIGGNITVVMLGDYTLQTADTNFAAAAVGTPVYLSTSGTYTLTPATTAGSAVVKIGIVHDVNKIWIDRQIMGVY